MLHIKQVHGTQEKVLPLELNVDTVYIRDNITQQIDEEGKLFWEYDEKQLTFEEYFRQIIPENEQAVVELSTLFSLYQSQVDSAIAELTMLLGGITNV